MKVATSATLHKTAEGQRISYTFSDVDDSGNVVSDNQRASMVVLNIEENTTLINAINTVMDYLNSILSE